MILKVMASAILASYSVYLGLRHVLYVVLNFCLFSPVSLSYIIELWDEPNILEGKKRNKFLLNNTFLELGPQQVASESRLVIVLQA